ncbi:MAG: hypothetical protein HBSAPP03_27510 [Phycisphaerae bacterium]|nr:MAG: hypothetical protein HBSAPP03_27510 [Phycisphaerae bacterium]
MPTPRCAKPERPLLDRYDLYERCVQSPRAMVRFLAAAHGGRPRLLREDFSGGAALCKAWVADASGRRAIAVDRDPEPLRRVAGVPGIVVRRADVHNPGDRADVIAALNFPLGYFHERASLLRYLRLSRARLRRGGVFVGDIYGGRSAFTPGTRRVTLRTPEGVRVRYEWDQRRADTLTGRVENAIHFTVYDQRPPRRLRDAFTYDWRLWSLPELRDAYAEAGYTHVDVFDQEAGAMDHLGNLHLTPVREGADLGDDWVVYVVGRR